jgi:hypothetical protein
MSVGGPNTGAIGVWMGALVGAADRKPEGEGVPGDGDAIGPAVDGNNKVGAIEVITGGWEGANVDGTDAVVGLDVEILAARQVGSSAKSRHSPSQRIPPWKHEEPTDS